MTYEDKSRLKKSVDQIENTAILEDIKKNTGLYNQILTLQI